MKHIIETTRKFESWDNRRGKYVLNFEVDFEHDYFHIWHTDDIDEAYLFNADKLSLFLSNLREYDEVNRYKYRQVEVIRETVIV